MHYSIKTVYSITLLVCCFACDKSEIYDKQNTEYKGATIEFDSVTTKYSEDAKLKIKIEAPLQQVFGNNDVFYPKGVHISMYNVDGIKTTDLQADTGRYEYATQKYVGRGCIKIFKFELKVRCFIRLFLILFNPSYDRLVKFGSIFRQRTTRYFKNGTVFI